MSSLIHQHGDRLITVERANAQVPANWLNDLTDSASARKRPVELRVDRRSEEQVLKFGQTDVFEGWQ